MKPDFIGVLESRRRPEIPGKGDTSVSPFFSPVEVKTVPKGTVFEIAKRRFPRLNNGQSVFAAVTAALHFFGLRLPFDP